MDLHLKMQLSEALQRGNALAKLQNLADGFHADLVKICDSVWMFKLAICDSMKGIFFIHDKECGYECYSWDILLIFLPRKIHLLVLHDHRKQMLRILPWYRKLVSEEWKGPKPSIVKKHNHPLNAYFIYYLESIWHFLSQKFRTILADSTACHWT